MSRRNEISDVTPVVVGTVGLPEGSSLSLARIYDHLSPRMQAILFQAKKVKEELHYQYCLFTKRLHIADHQAQEHGGPRRT